MTVIHDLLAPYYLVFKWVHLFFVAMWAFSTAVAYRYYVVPAFMAWMAKPEDAALKERRDWSIRAFDDGVILEHIAFPVILVTGATMVWLNGWALNEVYWLTVKLAIIAVVFIPMEVVDYHISHFAGRKSLSLAAGEADRYEAQVAFHWKFFVITAKLVRIFVPLVFFLAVVKPF